STIGNVGDLQRDIISVDWDQVRIGRAVSGLVAMLAVIAVVGLVGDVAFAALMATLFVTAMGRSGSMSERLPGMIGFTIVGAALGGLAFFSVDNPFAVAFVLGIATYLGTLAAAAGPNAARAGLYLTIWPLFAMMLGSGDTDPLTIVVAFLIGGGVAIAATAIRLWLSSAKEADATKIAADLEEGERDGRSIRVKLMASVSSPLGVFSLLRSAAVVMAVIIGFWWFADYPLWVAITVIVVVRPSATQSVSVAVERTLGTAIGVGLAVVIAQLLPEEEIAIALAFLVSGALMLAFNNANYTLFATFLTATLLFGQRLIQADAFEAGWERLLATGVGALIGLGIAAIAERFSFDS
ncbi:MAG: FUSC family protein, partial [Acidimicrobiia bacterium]